MTYHVTGETLNPKLSAQRNETETKQFGNFFENVLFQFHFVVRAVYSLTKLQWAQGQCLGFYGDGLADILMRRINWAVRV